VAEADPAWRGIDELAGLVGAYCWLEHRVFALAGAWASAPAEGDGVGLGAAAGLRVWCAAASRRHGDLAQRWAEHLPVRAGVDQAELVRAPAGPLTGALDALAAEPDEPARAGVLIQTVLPRVGGVYESHGRTAAPVSEGPVLEVLAQARRELAGEIRSGRTLLEGLGRGSRRREQLGTDIERAFDATRVFPAVRPS
jgi:hypothetical protein